LAFLNIRTFYCRRSQGVPSRKTYVEFDGFVSTKGWQAISGKTKDAGSSRRRRSAWSYYAAVDEIYHANWTAKQLARLRVTREAAGHFWPKGHPAKLIQVAGTSGKGSTARFIQIGLSAYGRAGCYLKPHVFDFSERFVVGEDLVGHEEIVEVWEKSVRPYCVDSALKGDAWTLDHFQASLLIALKVFERHRLDWAVIETGMGGRYDPVTSLEVVATVITNVGQDHEEALGAEHWQRALEKAGVCRPGVPTFSADTDPRSTDVIEAICRDVESPFRKVSAKDVSLMKGVVSKMRGTKEVDSLLSSEVQLWNAALAAEVVTALVGKVEVEIVARRFLGAKFVGRFWKVEKDVYADVAHNPNKTQALAEELEAKFPGTKKVFVVGISGVRDPVAVIGPLVRQTRAIVVTAAGFKGQDPEKVYTRLRDGFPDVPIHLSTDPSTTLSVAKNMKDAGEIVVYTGSTYMIDQALNRDEKLRHLNASVGWRDNRKKSVSGTLSFDIPEKVE
jgi:dihydrofolate synthase/folylpolyglutamate synthase